MPMDARISAVCAVNTREASTGRCSSLPAAINDRRFITQNGRAHQGRVVSRTRAFELAPSADLPVPDQDDPSYRSRLGVQM
jgi:hypothetical protein